MGFDALFWMAKPSILSVKDAYFVSQQCLDGPTRRLHDTLRERVEFASALGRRFASFFHRRKGIGLETWLCSIRYQAFLDKVLFIIVNTGFAW
jgi:hypothetical protein